MIGTNTWKEFYLYDIFDIDMGNKDKLADTVIWLPITSTGEPDWQYMEDYMREIMDKSEKEIEIFKKQEGIV